MAKNMKIAASKAMAAALNERIPEFTVSQVKLSAHETAILLPYAPIAERMRDALSASASGLYRALRIEYPANYYALPKYVSTSELLTIMDCYNCASIDDFAAAFRDIYAI